PRSLRSGSTASSLSMASAKVREDVPSHQDPFQVFLGIVAAAGDHVEITLMLGLDEVERSAERIWMSVLAQVLVFLFKVPSQPFHLLHLREDVRRLHFFGS